MILKREGLRAEGSCNAPEAARVTVSGFLNSAPGTPAAVVRSRVLEGAFSRRACGEFFLLFESPNLDLFQENLLSKNLSGVKEEEKQKMQR